MVYRVAGRSDGTEGPWARSTVVRIPGGTVVVDGAAVAVTSFLVDRNLVTRGEYRAYAKASGARMPPSDAGDNDLPVVNVTYVEAEAYAAWFEGRLPTEAEWQLAAVGFGDRAYPYGDGRSFAEDRGPNSWRDGLHVRRPRAVGVGAPLADGVFGVSDVGEVWELTSTRAPVGVVVRGGTWRDRQLPPRLDNRSTESEPACDVGFRCVYPLVAGPTDVGIEPGLIPGRRAPDETTWRTELLATSDGRRAYLEQQLARLGLHYSVEPTRMPADRILAFKTQSSWSPDDLAEMVRADAAWREQAKATHERCYLIGNDGSYYAVFVEGEYLYVTHSRQTAGTDGFRQSLVFGESATRLELGVFAALEYEASDFIRYVMAKFEPNSDSPT